jgi:fatty acid desaturase/membrane-associated phospholipid phosphatase
MALPGGCATTSGALKVHDIAKLSMASQARREDTQNWIILVCAVAASALFLWSAAHAASSLWLLAAAVGFGFTGNCIFSLLHEAVHEKFDTTPQRNRWAGHIAAAFFPTALTLQTVLHLTHHRNNRSELERFDYIGPDEAIPLKTGQWFTILTGLYWLSIPLFWIFYSLVAELVPWKRLVVPGSRFANQTSASEFLESARKLPVWRVRAELGFSLVMQAALFWLLDLTWWSWLACYYAFGLSWSSLQYVDHAFSRLDRREGAWNLKVSRLTRTLFLNYHDHLEHHRDMECRWQNLPKRIAEPASRISQIEMLYLMWKGPRLLPGASDTPQRQRLLDWSIVACHALIFAVAFQAIYGLTSLDYAARDYYLPAAIALDRAVPFVPEMGLVYVTIGPLLLLTALVLGKPQRTLPFLAALMFELVFAALCFLAFPVDAPVPPNRGTSEFAQMVFAMADGINLSGNMLPSLHVAFALSCGWVLGQRLSLLWRVLVWLWVLAICASTLLTWQHWIIDVVAGAALALFAMGILHPRLTQALEGIEAEIRAHPQGSGQKS